MRASLDAGRPRSERKCKNNRHFRRGNVQLKFKVEFDAAAGKYVTKWEAGDPHAIDVVLATNMLSVGVDVNRQGLVAVNGQPKGTAECIQATSRVGRSFPGLVCTVLTWARPRERSHYETFEHYHANFYKHVEAQPVTPFSPRAMDRWRFRFMRHQHSGACEASIPTM